MNNIVEDISLLAILFIFATLAIKFAYFRGKRVWIEEFGFGQPGQVYRHFGLTRAEQGELFNLVLIVGILFVLLILTPDASIVGLLGIAPDLSVIAVMLLVFIAIFYGRVAVLLKAKSGFTKDIALTPQNLGLLSAGYLPYSFYCAIIYLLGIAVFGLTFHQMSIDYINFQTNLLEMETIKASVSVNSQDLPNLMRNFEELFGRSRVVSGYVIDQVNSVLMLLLSVYLAYIAIYRSQFRQVFAESALKTLRLAIFVMVGICLFYGCYVFFTMYLVFVDSLLLFYAQFSKMLVAADWSYVRRYHEIIAELSSRRGIFGFLLALTTDRGGLILLVPILQYFAKPGDKQA